MTRSFFFLGRITGIVIYSVIEFNTYSTGRGAVCQCPKGVPSMDGSTSSRFATD